MIEYTWVPLTIIKKQGEQAMSCLDPIEGVSGVSSTTLYDPSNYTISSNQPYQSNSSIESMANSLGMSKKQEEKFISNVCNYISEQNKKENEDLIAKMKEATQAINQA